MMAKMMLVARGRTMISLVLSWKMMRMKAKTNTMRTKAMNLSIIVTVMTSSTTLHNSTTRLRGLSPHEAERTDKDDTKWRSTRRVDTVVLSLEDEVRCTAFHREISGCLGSLMHDVL